MRRAVSGLIVVAPAFLFVRPGLPSAQDGVKGPVLLLEMVLMTISPLQG